MKQRLPFALEFAFAFLTPPALPVGSPCGLSTHIKKSWAVRSSVTGPLRTVRYVCNGDANFYITIITMPNPFGAGTDAGPRLQVLAECGQMRRVAELHVGHHLLGL